MRVAIRFSLAFLLLATTCSGNGRFKERVVEKRTNEPIVRSNVFLFEVSFGSDTGSRGYASSPHKWDDLIPSSYASLLYIKEGEQ